MFMVMKGTSRDRKPSKEEFKWVEALEYCLTTMYKIVYNFV